MLSEILAPLFGCHQQLLLDDLRGRWSFGMKSELEVSDDLINDFMILDKGDNPHPTPTLRTDKRVYLINFFYRYFSTTSLITRRRKPYSLSKRDSYSERNFSK